MNEVLSITVDATTKNDTRAKNRAAVCTKNVYN